MPREATPVPAMIPRPYVSVIIPAFNAEERVRELLESLARQTYPADRFEALLVDNGSSDGTTERATEMAPSLLHSFTLLSETEVQSSYAARNKGLAHARGEIIAFTDSDCTPCPEWLERGVNALTASGAGLAAGHVRFTFASSKPTAAELIDARTNMQIERDVALRGVAKTANLFVRSEVFAAIGHFPSDVQSGADVSWTGRATARGIRLIFVREAEVAHPARSWLELFAKQVRVGEGQMPLLRAKGRSWASALVGWSVAKPPPTQSVAPRGKPSKPKPTMAERPSLALAAAWVASATLAGRLRFILKNRHWLP